MSGRYVILGWFRQVSFEVLGPRSSWHDRIVAASKEPNTRVLIAGLKRTLSHDSFVQSVLGSGHDILTSRVGLVVIDDEDYVDQSHVKSNSTGHVGLILRNYFNSKIVGIPGVICFPLGWRTTDGGFFDKHVEYFTSEYLAQQSSSPHATVLLSNISRSSQRPIRLFFVGTIREGGRMEMNRAVQALSEGLSADAADPSYKLCTTKDELVSSLSGAGVACTDVVLSSKGFLGQDLNVAEYYSVLNQSRFALVPCGVNPESYRLWEVLHSGTIPIVETCGSVHEHPFGARTSAIGLLPSVWSWTELPSVLAILESDEQSLDIRQHRIARWFSSYISDTVYTIANAIARL